jgi:hypothetical protein
MFSKSQCGVSNHQQTGRAESQESTNFIFLRREMWPRKEEALGWEVGQHVTRGRDESQCESQGIAKGMAGIECWG